MTLICDANLGIPDFISLKLADFPTLCDQLVSYLSWLLISRWITLLFLEVPLPAQATESDRGNPEEVGHVSWYVMHVTKISIPALL